MVLTLVLYGCRYNETKVTLYNHYGRSQIPYCNIDYILKYNGMEQISTEYLEKGIIFYF